MAEKRTRRRPEDMKVDMTVGAVLAAKSNVVISKTYWAGKAPLKDDWDDPITEEFIDGRTKYGPWAFMSPNNHIVHGVGLGMGKGQRYRLQDDGKWLKVEG